MADNNDGSIIIDTELDNEGFTKGSDKLLDAVKDLTGAVDNLGDNMMKSFGQVIPLLQNIATSAAQVNTAMSEGATQAADANARVAAVEQKVAQAAQQAAQQVEGEAQSMGNLSSKAAAAQTTVSGLEREVNSISTGMQGLSASAEKGFASGGAVLTFDQKLSDMETKISAAREKLEAFGATKIPTDDYQWMTENLSKAEAALNRLVEKQIKMEDTGVKQNSKSWRTLMYEIEQAKANVEDFRATMSSMESDGTAFTMGSDTEEYQRMQSSLDNCSGSLERNKALIDSEALAQARLNVQAAQEQVIRATTDGQRQAAMANLRTAQQELSNLAAQSSTAGAPKEESISGWQRFGAVLKGVGSAAVKVAGTLAKISFKAVSAGVKAVTGKLKQFVSQSKSTALSAKGLVKALTSVKTMLKTRIKRMFISAIVNNVKESMSSLAQFSSEFDTSMSNLQNGAKQLASNITVALGSLISAIEPLLSTIINGATKAVECFNALIASISGKSTVTVAKKKMDSYAASTSDAADAAKELKNQTYGFDQLNKRSSDSSSSSSSGSGADTYEEVPIDSIVPTELGGWFDRIKTAFANGDWTGLGLTIAEGFNMAFSAVDTWINDTLRPKAVAWTKNIANVLNGFVDGLDWGQVGKTIADGINTVFDIVNTFLTTFDFGKLGTGLGNAINGLFTNIDWKLIGATFANKWNALINFIFNLVSTIDWSKIGDGLSGFVNSFINTLDLQKAVSGIGRFINGIFTAFGTFMASVDWTSLATTLGNSITGLFTEIDWAGIVTTIITGFNTMVSSLATVLATIDWTAIGTTIANAITNLFTTLDWNAISTLLVNAVTGILNLLSTIIIETDWGAIISSVLTGIVNLVVTSLPQIIEAGIGLLLALVQGLIDAIPQLLAALPQIIEALLNGILEAIPQLINAGIQLLTALVTALPTIIQSIVEVLPQIITSIIDALLANLPLIIQAGIDLLVALIQALPQIITTIVEALPKIIMGIVDALIGNIDKIIMAGVQLFVALIENLPKIIVEIVKAIPQIITGIVKAIISFVPKLAEAGLNLLKGLWNGIKDAGAWLWDKISGFFGGIVDKIKGFFGIHSPSKLFAEIGGYLDAGLGNGISDGQKDVLKTASNLAQSVTDEMNADMPTLEASEGSVVTGLDAVASRLSGIAATFQAITTALNSIGGFRTPQIAAGTVVPVKTRIDGNPVSADGSGGLSEFTSNVDERMADISFLLKQLIAIVKALHLDIDIDALTEIITQQQRSKLRNFGGV